MTRTRRAATAALLGVLALTLGACSLPSLPGRGGPDLAASDVITLSSPSAGMTGFFGMGFTEITGDTITTRYELPNEEEIYALEEGLATEDRERIEEAAEQYVAWERTLSEKERTPCTDAPSLSVGISGSITHDSTVQDCGDNTPLGELTQRVDAAQSELSGQLAHPIDDWTVEIRPWAGNGPDESAEVERYELLAAQHEVGMGITAQNAPSGWGADLEPGNGEDGAPLGWDATGTVLVALNDVLLNQDQLGCGDQIGQITLTKQTDPALTWTYRLCLGQQTEALAEALRDL